jgi:hypothetical protein
LGEHGGNAINEGLTTDEAGPGMGLGLHRQMFAATEADFKPDLIQHTAGLGVRIGGRISEKPLRFERARFKSRRIKGSHIGWERSNIDADAWQ